MGVTHVQIGSTTYAISDCVVPPPDQLPWGSEECDAFVAILEPRQLTDKMGRRVSIDLVRLSTDWVETMGPTSELLHDLIDTASVETGRQSRVGDGKPMTAWHSDFLDLDSMVDYVRMGGNGGRDNKVIVVIASERSTALFAERLTGGPPG
jgi:hypothetical protein